MTSAPRLSVIVPAYNAASTVETCLVSLVGQTLRDLEVVFVDDGSTDETVAIAAGIAEDSAIPVRLIRRANGGRAAARNTGLDEARGEFLGFVDADDYAEPEMFEHLLECADRTGADMVACEYVSFDAATGAALHQHRDGESSQYGTSVAEHPPLLLSVGASLCNKLVRSSLFSGTGIRFPVGLDFEDLATTYRLAAAARRIDKLDEVLYHYRQGHMSSVMSACDERYLQITEALTTVNEYFIQAGLLDSTHDELEVVNFVHLISGRFDDLFLYGTSSVRHAFIERAYRHMDTFFPGWKRSAAIRASVRPAKRLVSTNKLLLELYTDLKAAPS